MLRVAMLLRGNRAGVKSIAALWSLRDHRPENYEKLANSTKNHVFHFNPQSCSWRNAVEGFLSKLTRRRLKRAVFRSIVELRAAINRFLAETNDDPKPFVWTAHPDRVIAAVQHGMQALESVH